MEYKLRVQYAMYGDAIPLIDIAEVMARHAASGYGALPMHGPTLKNKRPDCIGLLLQAADAGLLMVCDSAGCAFPVEDIIAAATLPPVQIGLSSNSRRISALHVSIKHLNDWARSNGNEFRIENSDVYMIEFDLKNEKGKILKKGYFRSFIGESASTLQPAPAMELVTPAAKVPASKPQKATEGITKGQVLIAFEEMVKPFDLKKALGNGKGLFGDDGARTQKGSRGGKHAALWNPVILAVGLNEKYAVPMLHLKKAFFDHSFLRSRSVEWSDTLDRFGK